MARKYRCTACTHTPKGQYIFTVEWSDTFAEPEATRCPRCGALEPDIKEEGCTEDQA